MSKELLTLLALLQGAILVLLFALLTWHRLIRSVRDRYRARKASQIVASARRWLLGAAPDGSVETALRLASVPAGGEALETLWSSLDAGERDRLRQRFRGTGWFDRVRQGTRSLFWWKRMESTQIVAMLGDDTDADLLRPRLQDRVPAVRVAAIFAARELAPRDLLTELVDQLRQAQPARGKALQDALMAYGPEVVPAVARQVSRPDLSSEERANLLALVEHVARRHPDPELSGHVLPFVSDPDLEVRVRAVRALAALPEVAVNDVLLGALADPAWEVRAQAAKALGNRDAASAIGPLRRALHDPEWWVRLRAGVALRQHGARGRDALADAVRGEDEFARDMSTYVLRLDERALTEYVP